MIPTRREGNDGKLYFKYNLGAVYEVKPPVSAPFTYQITACEFENGSEKEYYRIKSAGAELPARFSVNQVDLMLAQLPCTQTEEGEPQELPLLLEEVQEFFNKKRAELSKANIAENKKLKGTAWNKNLQARATVSNDLSFYRSCGNAAKVAELEKRIAEIDTEQNTILKEKGVDLRVLTKQADCPLCKDFGVIDGQICECVRSFTTAIKNYCAGKRLDRR